MPLIFQVTIALCFSCACCGVGLIGLRRTPSSEKISTIEKATLAFALGNVIYSYIVTACASVGLLRIWILWALFIGGVLLAAILLFRAKHEWQRPRMPWLLVAIASPFFLAAILMSLAPPFLRDTLVYHLRFPKLYLEAGALVTIPGHVFGAFPKGQEMLQTLLLGIAGDRTVQFFGVVQLAFAVAGTYGFLARKTSRQTATVMAAFVATSPVIAFFSGGGYVLPAILLTLTALIIVMDAAQSETIGPALIGGLLAGWLVAIKYTGAIYGGAFGLLYLYCNREKTQRSQWLSATVFALATLPGFFFIFRNWIELHNPVFPFAYNLFGGIGWDVERSLGYAQTMANYGVGSGIARYLLLPFHLAFSGQFDSMAYDGYAGPAAFAVILLALVRPFVKTEPVYPAGFSLVTLAACAFFAFGTQQLRFYMPAHLLLCFYAAPLLDRILSRLSEKRWGRVAWIAALILLVAPGGAVLYKQSLKVGFFKPVFGMESEADFKRRVIPGYDAFAAANHMVPTNGKVLLVWMRNYGYLLDVPFESDSFLEDHTLKTMLTQSPEPDAFFQELRHRGFTHILMQLNPTLESLGDGLKSQLIAVLRQGGVTLAYDAEGYSLIALPGAEKGATSP